MAIRRLLVICTAVLPAALPSLATTNSELTFNLVNESTFKKLTGTDPMEGGIWAGSAVR